MDDGCLLRFDRPSLLSVAFRSPVADKPANVAISGTRTMRKPRQSMTYHVFSVWQLVI